MAFEETMAEVAEEAVTEEEVAELPEESTDEGSNETEIAEQSSESVASEPQDSRTNRAFQEMRHQKEALERELSELKASQTAREKAMKSIGGDEYDEIAVIAEATGLTEDEVRAEFERAENDYKKDAEIEMLRNQIAESEAERIMASDLAEIRKIDPSITDLNQLGDEYVEYIRAGASAKQAYMAIKAEEILNRAEPPKEIGKVNQQIPEKDYYTDAEIEKMSSTELSKNWKKVLASWGRK